MKMHESKEVPAVRFAGVEGDWETKKLGDIYEERDEPGEESLGILSVSIHSGISDRELDLQSLGKRVRRSEDKSLYKQVHPGDLVFNMMRAWQGAAGVTRVRGMVSPAYIAAIPTSDISAEFMNQAIRRASTVKQMNDLSYGVTDFRKRLYWDSFVQLSMSLPAFTEQSKIGRFFECLDSFIGLQHNELEKLKQLKVAMLGKMFPRPGSDAPEVRFHGFEGAWEEREFGDVALRRSVVMANSDLPVVEYEDIVSGEGRLIEGYAFPKRLKSGIPFTSGDILYGKLRPYLRNNLLPKFSGVAVGDFWVLQAISADPSFVFALIQSTRFDAVANQSTGTKMPRADWGLVSRSLFPMAPTRLEQAKVGELFEKLDALIGVKVKMIEKLDQIKRSLLSKMFV